MCAEVNSPEGVFDFEMVLPTPRQLFEGNGWYNWRVSNWGTKWEADGPTVEQTSPEELTYRFFTAWSPPSPLIETLGMNFPSLCFVLEYDEPGNGFMGRLEVRSGQVALDQCQEMDEDFYEENYGA